MCDKKLKIAVVENDIDQSERIQNYIKRYSEENNEECVCIAFRDGIDFVSDYSGDFDAVFMDIEMPMMDGMTAAEKLREIDENVFLIFVTNFEQYAIKGYHVNALDYLVKPVDYFEFSIEMKKISNLCKKRFGEFVWLTVSGAIRRVPLIDIKYFEIINHNVYVHTLYHTYQYRGTLKETEAKITSKNFSRCHNCFIVNLRYVAGINGDEIILDDGTKIFVSRNKKKAFMTDLTSYIAKNGVTMAKGV